MPQLPPPYTELLAETLITPEQLQARIAELGAEFSQDYAGKDLLLICILRGGVMFLTDLVRHISVPHMMDFMAVSSYGAGARKSSGQVRITMDLSLDIAGRNVVLVEDIVDTGTTMAWLCDHFRQCGARTVKICALIDKKERRLVPVEVDYVGFVLEQGFLVGYGLDCAEKYRNLPAVYSLDE